MLLLLKNYPTHTYKNSSIKRTTVVDGQKVVVLRYFVEIFNDTTSYADGIKYSLLEASLKVREDL
jgi:hypothetical protein